MARLVARSLMLWLGLMFALLAETQGAEAGFLAKLAAVNLSADQVHPGGTLNVSYEWINIGTSPADEEYTVFVHVRPTVAGVSAATGSDYLPATPTFAWPPQVPVQDRQVPITLPANFPPGRYELLVGLYNPRTGQRQTLANNDLVDQELRYRIATLEVVPRDKPLGGGPLARRWHDTRGLPQAAEPVQAPAGKTIVLDSGKLRVMLSAERPLVLGYESPGGKKLLGDSSGYPLRVRSGRAGLDTYRTVCLREASSFTLDRKPSEARYAVRIMDEGVEAARFDLVFRLHENVLRAGVESVREAPGHLLMDVFLPQLVSTRATAGQLVVPTQAGRLVHLNRSPPGRHVVNMNWMEVDLCGAVVGDGLAAAVRTRDWDNELEAQMAGPEGRLSGGYAVRLALRAEAAGKAARIQLAQTPAVEVAIVDRGEGGKPPGWVEAAKWLRHDLTGSPNQLYEDTYIYKIFCDTPGSRDYTTFEEALDIIRRVHQLAPWLKQVVYLVGWQFQGHDTGYPATDEINARLGGIDTLRRVAAQAAKYNAILSYHDNFDDAYRESPRWDETVIAHDLRGGLQKGGVWAGGQSYILAFNKYAMKEGLERVRRTIGQMPVRASYHIDVLSAVPMRRDYHPEHPETTQASLEGKFAIVREFNRLGIDVTSEGFTAPFVGVIGHSWQLWWNHDPLFAGEEPIPFIPMIYHGGPTTYGHGVSGDAGIRESCLYGAACTTEWTKHATMQQIAEPIYLILAPWTSLRNRKMQGFERQGDLCRVTYDRDTFVEVNQESGQWRVVVDGQTMIENDLAVIRKGDLVGVYSLTARTTSVDLPAPLRGKDLKITNGCTGSDLTPQAQRTASAVTLRLPAREPLLIEVRQ